MLRQRAAQAADVVEQQVLNRYQAGQVSYTEVVTAQVTAQNARPPGLISLERNADQAANLRDVARGDGTCWQGAGVTQLLS